MLNNSKTPPKNYAFEALSTEWYLKTAMTEKKPQFMNATHKYA